MIAVLGPGGVGGLLAALLQRSGTEVTVVAREPTAELIAERGLSVESAAFGDFKARPPAVAEFHAAEADTLIVATKANGLAPALERVHGEPGLVVPLLNGIDHIAALRERYGTRAMAASIRVESTRPQPGVIVHTSSSVLVELASADPAMHERMAELVGALRAAGIDAAIGRSEAEVMWSKLVRLNALALTTAASGRTIGEIRTGDRWRNELHAAIDEAVAVAVAEGVAIEAADVRQELESAHATLSSSMARDVAAGREPELDAISGAVLRAGRRHGIACPTIEVLAAIVRRRIGEQPPSSR